MGRSGWNSEWLDEDFADQSTANEPRKCFDEKIAREVIVFFAGPLAHGKMAHECRELPLKKNEAGRTVGKKTNVFEGSSDEAATFADKAGVQRVAEGRDEGEDDAFGRDGRERGEFIVIDKISSEETRRRAKCREPIAGWRLRNLGMGMQKPVTAKRAVRLREGFVAP